MTSQRSHVSRGIITKKLMHSNAYKLNYYGFMLYSALLMQLFNGSIKVVVS